jgi:hypothetical protein
LFSMLMKISARSSIKTYSRGTQLPYVRRLGLLCCLQHGKYNTQVTQKSNWLVCACLPTTACVHLYIQYVS